MWNICFQIIQFSPAVLFIEFSFKKITKNSSLRPEFALEETSFPTFRSYILQKKILNNAVAELHYVT